LVKPLVDLRIIVFTAVYILQAALAECVAGLASFGWVGECGPPARECPRPLKEAAAVDDSIHMESTDQDEETAPGNNLGKAIPLVIIGAFGLVWLSASYVLAVGCENACTDSASYPIFAAGIGTVAFIGADVAELKGQKRWAGRLLAVGLLAAFSWLAMVSD
jgi:hypothetical protein